MSCNVGKISPPAQHLIRISHSSVYYCTILQYSPQFHIYLRTNKLCHTYIMQVHVTAFY